METGNNSDLIVTPRMVEVATQTDSLASTTKGTIVFDDTKKEKKLEKRFVKESAQIGWFRPVTRSKTGVLMQQRQSLKENNDSTSSDEDEMDDDDDYDGTRPGSKKRKLNYVYEEFNDGTMGVRTCIPVNHIPMLFDRLTELLKLENDIEKYDIYAIQTLFLNCAMDVVHFKSESQLLEFVKKIVIERPEFKISGNKVWRNPVPQPSYDEEEDQRVIEAYDELLESEEQERLRSYRSDSKFAKKWTASDRKQFEQGFSKGLTNREIAEQMGGGVHANHVTIYRSQYLRKTKKKAKKEEEEDNDHE